MKTTKIGDIIVQWNHCKPDSHYTRIPSVSKIACGPKCTLFLYELPLLNRNPCKLDIMSDLKRFDYILVQTIFIQYVIYQWLMQIFTFFKGLITACSTSTDNNVWHVYYSSTRVTSIFVLNFHYVVKGCDSYFEVKKISFFKKFVQIKQLPCI